MCIILISLEWVGKPIPIQKKEKKKLKNKMKSRIAMYIFKFYMFNSISWSFAKRGHFTTVRTRNFTVIANKFYLVQFKHFLYYRSSLYILVSLFFISTSFTCSVCKLFYVFSIHFPREHLMF